MSLQLVALKEGSDIPLDKPLLLLGRNPDCDVLLHSPKVSRRHCCIAQVNDRIFVRDLGSTNGIRINGVRVAAGCLNLRDELRIGKLRYRLECQDRPAADASTAPAAESVEPPPAAGPGEVPVPVPRHTPPPRGRRSRPAREAATGSDPTPLPPTRLLADSTGRTAADPLSSPEGPRSTAPPVTLPEGPAQEAEAVPPAPADAGSTATATAPRPLPETPVPPGARSSAARPEAAPPACDDEDEDASATPRWLFGISLGALFLGPAALLCASALVLCDFVLPVSLAGLLTGLAAVALSVQRRAGLRLPVAGAMVSGAVLAAALLVPGLLGPTYLLSRQQDVPDRGGVRAIPLPGRSRVGAVQDPEWADASRAVLEQGGLRAQVVDVSLGRVKVPGAPKTKYTAKKYLLVRVRFQQIQGGKEFARRDWKPPNPRDGAERATLTDGAGKVYLQRDVYDVGGVQRARRSSVFPVAVVEEVFVFEPPPAGAGPLRLEIPAAAWGVSGSFRFSIPGSMIRRTPGG